ncbi:MAG: NADH-quinone oxidoreductase subunit N [Clostridiales bacterium]|nr:NADH-quinone oxidoreductase subunit N [Clostridiales bacterium]
MLPGYWILAPEVLVVIGALVVLFGDVLFRSDRKAAYAGAAFAGVAAVLAGAGGTADPMVFGQIEPDAMARFARTGIAALTAVWALWVAGRGMPGERCRDAVALALFAAGGGMLLTMAEDLIVMYIALELSTMPAYVLMGYRRRDVAGLEGALKYFLLAMLTSIIMVYGMSFLYGISGSTAFSELTLEGSGMLGVLAVMLTLVGMFAKMSAAPFHYWAPDAYAGASAASVAFVSTVPKIAGIAVMARLLAEIAGDVAGLTIVLAVVAVASMALGNLAALPQPDIRRLMAYSGVAHTGYLFMALAPDTAAGYGAAVFYSVAYAVPSMAIMLIAAEEGSAVADLGQLGTRRPVAAWSMVVWLVSLIGIPPLAGFFGKLGLFASALSAGLTWLVVIGVLASVVSAGYYFRVVREMFFGEMSADKVALERAPASSLALAFALVATVAMGVAASPLLAALGVGIG